MSKGPHDPKYNNPIKSMEFGNVGFNIFKTGWGIYTTWIHVHEDTTVTHIRKRRLGYWSAYDAGMAVVVNILGEQCDMSKIVEGEDYYD